ncbi:MAG TPA: nucleoside deaminase [Polyangiaceae bacterium]|nr:nucleoside deaminase [Polyangiaceae bacterium]
MTTATAEDFMRRAIELARSNIGRGEGGPFGALIVLGDQIVAEGRNRVTSANDPTAHAEIVAIRAACHKLSRFSLAGAQIYTSCEPCPMCLAAIHWARLDQIHYAATREDAGQVGFDDALLYRELSLPIQDRATPMKQLAQQEAVSVMQDWMKDPKRIVY